MKRSLKNDKMKTYAEINEKIKKGTAVVLTAEEGRFPALWTECDGEDRIERRPG